MEFAAAYMDDLVVYTNTWEEHLQHLQAILQRLQTAGLTAKPSKCQFACAECTYLGHIVGGGQVKPLPSKLQAIQDFPTPTTKKQVRTFLGLTGYYRRFIKRYASTSAILSDLTRAKQPNNVKWTPKIEEAFRQLKQSLCTTPVLMVPNFERKLKRFLSKSKGCRVVKSTTGQQCKLTRNKHGMVTRLTC